MNRIDNSRSAFFPNSKEGRAQRIKQSLKGRMVGERNRPDRIKELSRYTERDAKVDIPSAVKDYSRIKKAVDMAPPIDNSSRISNLKRQIQSGDYQINYDALADKMIAQDF